jgi:signal transduction histidine kinase
MSSEARKRTARSAAWGISCWGTLGFAIGTLIVFVFLHRFVANDIQRRNDAWLWGEVSLLGEIAERTPRDAIYAHVVGEIADIVRKEIPSDPTSPGAGYDQVFFLQQGEDGSLKLWVGAGSGEDALNSIRQSGILPDQPIDLNVNSIPVPFRVVSSRIEDGSYIYLGLSESEQLRILSKFRLYFSALWAVIVVFGFGLIFSISRGLLNYVQRITDAASRIGRSDVKARVPTRQREDEVGHLAFTLNNMLDRIESSMHQLHTMTDSLAHDIRSPITAIRGKLETSLDEHSYEELRDAVISSIELLDHLSLFLTESLDVAEASAGALRLNTVQVDLRELLFTLVDYYRPSFAERQLSIECSASESARLNADAGLMHRMMANLLENELAHVPPQCTVRLTTFVEGPSVYLFVEDDGPGFPPELIPDLFERHTKGKGSKGHGLGLAFVDAVVRAHGGSVTAENGVPRGARIRVDLPIEVEVLAVRSKEVRP